MKIERIWAMPNKWTFTIKPIKELVERYVGNGKGWIDPLAGKNSPAEFTNDINPDMPTKYHLLAVDFIKKMRGIYEGVLFDPPYSPRQISECYKYLNRKVSQIDTSSHFWSVIKDIATPKIKMGGYAISFGWNSNGFGKNRGFEIVEILLVPHGGFHNDTIITVEKKIK